MRGFKQWVERGAWCACLALLGGCVTTTPPTPETWREAAGPAWSYNALPKELAVNVSPAGDSLRWGGSVGTVVGRGVDMAQNASYRNRITEALGDYDSAHLLEEELAARLQAAHGRELHRATGLRTMAGHPSREAAENAYYDQLARTGVDLLLEVQSRHGVFGPDATVATALQGVLYALPGRKRLWREELVVTPGPAYAFAALGDPTRTTRIIPRTDLRFGVDGDRLDSLTADKAALLKAELDDTRDGAIAGLITGMGLNTDARGAYTLGRAAMAARKFDDARARFEQAVAMDPRFPEAQSALAVAMAHQGNVDEAIARSAAIIESHPDFVPAHANLSWWYAKEKDDAASARRHFDAVPATDTAVRAVLEEALAN